MSVRINLEIGHEAAIRTKRTQEGFTHDWEVFVRGCDGANIHYYVEKVAFYLHETFPKPKRVVKEPPYSVKESGYAGFTLPIEIYLRNKDEPKKISFNYDLHLQQTGPAILKVQKEKYVFNLPGDDFKLKLLKGGGAVVSSSSSQEINRESRPASEEKSQLVSKPRLGGSDFMKKHKPKIDEPRTSNSFQDLFGPPITKTSKSALESKPISKDKNSNISKLGTGDKEKSKNKHSPHKEKEKVRDKSDPDRPKVKEDKKREEKKDRSRDREDRIKDKKEKREKSPKARSPTPTKRASSPKRPPSPPALKYKDEKKLEVSKEKRNCDDKEKLEKKAKKEKREKDKEKKENKHKDKDTQKSIEQRDNKITSREKEKHKEKEPSSSPPKIEKRDKSKEVMKDYIKETKELDHVDKNGKIKNEKLEEKPKHKHKKKDKEKKDKDKLLEREKSQKSEKKIDKATLNAKPKYIETKDLQKENEKSSLFSSPKHVVIPVESKIKEKPKKPLNALLAEFPDSDTSNSSISSREDLFNEPVLTLKVEQKKEPLFEATPPKIEPEKYKTKREKSKKNKDKKAEKDIEKKRKRKLDSSKMEEPLDKIPKDNVPSNSNSKDFDVELNSKNSDVSEQNENYEDYMNILRDLQHKILTLQDNAELQRVVQLIAETGRFEVSAQTFDFDLCLLERSTITQLQNFFQSTS